MESSSASGGCAKSLALSGLSGWFEAVGDVRRCVAGPSSNASDARAWAGQERLRVARCCRQCVSFIDAYSAPCCCNVNLASSCSPPATAQQLQLQH